MRKMKTTTQRLVFYVNGKKVEETNPIADMMLVVYLRRKLLLTGTKQSCSEGGCGACTVMLSQFDHQNKLIRHWAVNSCITPVCAVHGLAVTTVEGVGSTQGKLHPIQERIAKYFGTQCGFCSPGFVMSLYALLRQNTEPSRRQIETALQGNLCRCTGYRPILDAAKTFAKDGCCGNYENCCKIKPEKGVAIRLEPDAATLIQYDPTQEPIFPPQLQVSDELWKDDLHFVDGDLMWLRPASMTSLFAVWKEHPDARLVAGYSETVFSRNKPRVVIQLIGLPELRQVSVESDKTTIGAGVSLSCAIEQLRVREDVNGAIKTLCGLMEKIGSLQIRNSATIGGNLCSHRNNADLHTVLIALGASANLRSADGKRTISVEEMILHDGLTNQEVIESVVIPHNLENEFSLCLKSGGRQEFDFSILSFACKVRLSGSEIKHIKIVIGGTGCGSLVMHDLCAQLQGSPWTDDLLTKVNNQLKLTLEEREPKSDRRQYHISLASGMFFRFFCQVNSEALNQNSPTLFEAFGDTIKSTAQIYEEEAGEKKDPLFRPVPYSSSSQQMTGEAEYCDDITPGYGELHGALVLSTEAHARIVEVDTSRALALDGVEGYVDHTDIPGDNICGECLDELVFAVDTVTCYGQTIGLIVATSPELAAKAAEMVIIKYEKLAPRIITIDEAIQHDSYHKKIHRVLGDNSKLTSSEHVISGEVYVGQQDHYYMEPQSCLVIPRAEHDEMEVFASTQGPFFCQKQAAQVLGVPYSRIQVRTKRLGGGFGGKGSRSVISVLPTVVAARKFQRRVRLVIDRRTDLNISGHRHMFKTKYSVGFDSSGKVQALKLDVYMNGGSTLDESLGVLAVNMGYCPSAYYIPNLEMTGYCCKTNIPTDTAMRTYGVPQGIMVTETWLYSIACKLGLPPHEVRKLNMLKRDQRDVNNQDMSHMNVENCWIQCLEMSEFLSRSALVEQFNKENRHLKRGIALVPVKFNVGVPVNHINAGACLVHIYTDGSVLMSHGGIEMGQGLTTKLIQIASHELDVSQSRVHVSETSTMLAPNERTSGGSICFELLAPAVTNACKTLVQRLKPFKDAAPDAGWDKWVMNAYKDRVSLSTTGYSKHHQFIDYNHATNTGLCSFYTSTGVACSEVQLDVLSGQHTVLRSDLVMDIGKSVNPGVDFGQIEGAFVQGLGLYTCEELLRDEDGHLKTTGPATYKLPTVASIPRIFNVAFLRNAKDPAAAICSAKGMGEPPLLLSVSVPLALRQAVSSARIDRGLPPDFRLDTPYTPERLCLACNK